MYNEKDFDLDVIKKALGDMHLIQLKLESDIEFKNMQIKELEEEIKTIKDQIV